MRPEGSAREGLSREAVAVPTRDRAPLVGSSGRRPPRGGPCPRVTTLSGNRGDLGAAYGWMDGSRARPSVRPRNGPNEAYAYAIARRKGPPSGPASRPDGPRAHRAHRAADGASTDASRSRRLAGTSRERGGGRVDGRARANPARTSVTLATVLRCRRVYDPPLRKAEVTRSPGDRLRGSRRETSRRPREIHALRRLPRPQESFFAKRSRGVSRTNRRRRHSPRPE